MVGKVKYFLAIVLSLGITFSMFLNVFAWGAVDVEDSENLPLTLEEYHDAWVSYLDDRLDYACQQGDERLENAMLWCLEHHTKEETARWLKEGSLGIRSVAENVIFEQETWDGGITRFWVGSAEGKEVVRMPTALKPDDNEVYEFSLSFSYQESTENGNVSVN